MPEDIPGCTVANIYKFELTFVLREGEEDLGPIIPTPPSLIHMVSNGVPCKQ